MNVEKRVAEEDKRKKLNSGGQDGDGKNGKSKGEGTGQPFGRGKWQIAASQKRC